MGKLVYAITHRQRCLGMALAEAQGVPVHRIELRSSPPVPIWDFRSYRDLIQIGYEIAYRQISDWNETGQASLALPALIAENQTSWASA